MSNKTVYIALCVLLLTCCKTVRHSASQSAADSASQSAAAVSVVVRDTLHSASERIVFVFDTMYRTADVPQSAADLIAWAASQGVRSVEIESAALNSGSVARAGATVMAQERKTQVSEQSSGMERKTDATAMWGMYAALAAVACVGLYLVYRYFGGR